MGAATTFPITDGGDVYFRTRSTYQNWNLLPPLSIAYDTEVTRHEYCVLLTDWILGTNVGTPSDMVYINIWGPPPNTEWTTSIARAVFTTLADWEGYRCSGVPEDYRYANYALKIWAGCPCGGTNVTSPPCDKGNNICNVMMFDETNTSAAGVFPFSYPAWAQTNSVPSNTELAAMYMAALYYDIANDAGLGLYNTDLLIWKTISLITNVAYLPIRSYGSTIQQAADALWPDGRYDQDIFDVLTSRGIPLNGVTNFRSNLPAAIGPVQSGSANNFGSAHPDSQPNVNSYGEFSGWLDSYTQSNNPAYVAYQFYKYSKYGPCDELRVTDGSFNPSTGVYNGDGSYYLVLTNRQLGNLTVLSPGAKISWVRWRERCPNEATGYFAEDVNPFGFRVIQATANGFSFTVSALSTNQTTKTYQLSIVDPSTNTLGAASYAWAFSDYLGNTNTVSGSVVQYAAFLDEPFTINITRTRGSQTDNLTLRERGNDLDRCGGNAFVMNMLPDGAVGVGEIRRRGGSGDGSRKSVYSGEIPQSAGN